MSTSSVVGDGDDDDHLRVEVLAHQRRTLHALAEEVVPLEGGLHFRTRSLPLVWTLNQVRLAGPLAAEEIVAIADRFQSDLGFRHVVIEGYREDARLHDVLSALGWAFERDVLMVMPRRVQRHVDTARVVELSEDQMLSLMRDWLLEEFRDVTEDGLSQVLEYYRRQGRHYDELRLGVVDEGMPLAVAKLRVDGDVAWVEDVYTVPSARGRGHSRALLEAALRAAWDTCPRLTYIIADDNGWPKAFYGRAGFLPVGVNSILHRAGP